MRCSATSGSMCGGVGATAADARLSESEASELSRSIWLMHSWRSRPHSTPDEPIHYPSSSDRQVLCSDLLASLLCKIHVALTFRLLHLPPLFTTASTHYHCC